MDIIKKLIASGLFSIAIIAVSGCSDSKEEQAHWVTGEVLLQLSDLKTEIKEIKEQLQKLNNGLSRKGGKPAVLDKISLGSNPLLGANDAQFAIIEFITN